MKALALTPEAIKFLLTFPVDLNGNAILEMMYLKDQREIEAGYELRDAGLLVEGSYSGKRYWKITDLGKEVLADVKEVADTKPESKGPSKRVILDHTANLAHGAGRDISYELKPVVRIARIGKYYFACDADQVSKQDFSIRLKRIANGTLQPKQLILIQYTLVETDADLINFQEQVWLLVNTKFL